MCVFVEWMGDIVLFGEMSTFMAPGGILLSLFSKWKSFGIAICSIPTNSVVRRSLFCSVIVHSADRKVYFTGREAFVCIADLQNLR